MGKLDIALIADQDNLIDSIRNPNDLKYSESPVILHNLEFCGKSPIEKYQETFEFIESNYDKSKFLTEVKANEGLLGLIVTRLDNIACKIYKNNPLNFLNFKLYLYLF